LGDRGYGQDKALVGDGLEGICYVSFRGVTNFLTTSIAFRRQISIHVMQPVQPGKISHAPLTIWEAGELITANEVGF